MKGIDVDGGDFGKSGEYDRRGNDRYYKPVDDGHHFPS